MLLSTTVCDLGILIDGDVAMRSRVAYSVRMFAVLRSTAPQHQTFSVEFARRVAGHATSRLYGNATRAGLPASQLRPLHSVLNAAARLHRSSRYEHVTPMLRDLHWLRSPERIDFKLAELGSAHLPTPAWSGATISCRLHPACRRF